MSVTKNLQKVGIISYGVYIPVWRLSLDKVSEGLRGMKAVANYDEDSVTMAVAAAVNCLKGMDRTKIDGLFFASTTSPYLEKGASSIIAVAADLRRDVITADFAHSLRGGTSAIKAAVDAVAAGSAKQILVVVSDCRLGAPGSSLEQNGSDGAAAFVIGDTDVAAVLESSYSICNEMMDVWRVDGEPVIRTWEERFIAEHGYTATVQEAVSDLMKRDGLAPKDFERVIFAGSDPRRHIDLAKILKFDPKIQVQDPLFGEMGNTGAAFPLMLLVAALEKAKSGERLLLTSYGDGADVFVLRATEQVEKVKNRGGMKKLLESKKMIPDYDTYLQWKGFLSKAGARRRPQTQEPSATGLWRERDKNLRLYGGKCKVCGTIQYPIERICATCHARDQFENVRLSDKGGKLFTYSLDYIGNPIDIPRVIAVVDFDGGGRIFCYGTDRDANEIKVGMPVEMSFRKLFYTQGFHNYFWKCAPVR